MTDSLTAGELAAVERTWALVAKDCKGNGTQIFLALFKTFPEYQKLFKRFKDMSIEELTKSTALKAHGSTFMHGLAAMMDNIEDPETLISVTQDNVERHYNRGIRIEHYKNTFSIVPGFLQAQLGDEMDADAISGWAKVINIVESVMQKKLEELENQ